MDPFEHGGTRRETGAAGRRAVPVSAEHVARVVSRALSERPRLRLTSGQRTAILNLAARPGAARA